MRRFFISTGFRKNCYNHVYRNNRHPRERKFEGRTIILAFFASRSIPKTKDMSDKKKRLSKTEQAPGEPDKSDPRKRFGAVAFEENLDLPDDEEENVLSLDSLRAAFAGLDVDLENADLDDGTEEPEDDPVEIEYDEEPFDETLGEDLFEAEISVEPEAMETAVELSPRTILEAMLFVGDRGNRPLAAEKASEKMRNVEPEEIDRIVDRLNRDYAQRGCPYEIRPEKDGYRMVLRDDFDAVRARFYGKIRETRLSQQAIDTLAVVAYRQPITAEEVQKIRKQPSASLLGQLVRRGLLATEEDRADKRPVPLYRTTERFLKLFQLDSIEDLPVSDDFDFR